MWRSRDVAILGISAFAVAGKGQLRTWHRDGLSSRFQRRFMRSPDRAGGKTGDNRIPFIDQMSDRTTRPCQPLWRCIASSHNGNAGVVCEAPATFVAKNIDMRSGLPQLQNFPSSVDGSTSGPKHLLSWRIHAMRECLRIRLRHPSSVHDAKSIPSRQCTRSFVRNLAWLCGLSFCVALFKIVKILEAGLDEVCDG